MLGGRGGWGGVGLGVGGRGLLSSVCLKPLKWIRPWRQSALSLSLSV